MKEIEIITRPYDPKTDDPYIYSTWVRYSWYSPKEPIHASKKQFFREKSAEVKDHLENSKIVIACLKNDPYVIMGYSVKLEGNLLWLCVKKDYRNHGIEELLLK